MPLTLLHLVSQDKNHDLNRYKTAGLTDLEGKFGGWGRVGGRGPKSQVMENAVNINILLGI